MKQIKTKKISITLKTRNCVSKKPVRFLNLPFTVNNQLRWKIIFPPFVIIAMSLM